MVEQSFTALSLKQTFHRTTPVPGRDPPLSLPRPSSAHLTSPRLASPRRPSSNPTGGRERRDERRQGSESWRDPRRRARRKGKQSKAGSFGLCWAVAWLDRLSRAFRRPSSATATLTRPPRGRESERRKSGASSRSPPSFLVLLCFPSPPSPSPSPEYTPLPARVASCQLRAVPSSSVVVPVPPARHRFPSPLGRVSLSSPSLTGRSCRIAPLLPPSSSCSFLRSPGSRWLPLPFALPGAGSRSLFHLMRRWWLRQ